MSRAKSQPAWLDLPDTAGRTHRKVRIMPRQNEQETLLVAMASYPTPQTVFFSAALTVLGIAGSTPTRAQPDEGVMAMIADHHSRYPQMGLDDLYKLIHQASMGSEHAVSDTASARRWLSEELRQLGEGPDEPLLDPLTSDSGLVRVHLRPFLKSGGDPDVLLQAFIRTANLNPGSSEELERCWSIAVRMAEEGSLAYNPPLMRDYIAAKRLKRFPAVHHSDAYAAAYRPAYRVVARSFIPPGLKP